MKEVLDQELKSVRQSTTETTTLEDNTPAIALKPTGNQNAEDIKLLTPPGLSTEKKGKDLLYSGKLTRNDMLDCLKEIEFSEKNKILIVDDDPAIVYFLKAILEEDGTVETAENGQEVLQLTKRHYFDVIISDIDMPILNGIEFYKKASAMDYNIGKRFLFISAEPSPEDVDFFDKNNLTYMIKPVLVNEMEEAIHNITGRTLTYD